MIDVDIHEVASFAKIVSGDLNRDKLTLFAPMRNESHFLPAWLEHHRAIGFEQFLIWDDASDDGTFELLQANSDCIVMQSDLRYSEKVSYTDPGGTTTTERLGTVFKSALPHALLQGTYVGYLDADEFLILPSNVNSVRDIISRLEKEDSSAVMATVIEFFPATITELSKGMPTSFKELVKAYPFIQAEKLIESIPGKTNPRVCNPSKSKRLFAQHDVSFPSTASGAKKFWRFITGRRPKREQGSPRFKTPLIKRSPTSFQIGSHKSNLPPSATTLLTVAHFVFTTQSYAKAQLAIRERAHANGSRKYHGYVQLFDKMI